MIYLKKIYIYTNHPQVLVSLKMVGVVSRALCVLKDWELGI